MATRPNPTQHTAADEREFRAYVRLRLPAGKALDKADLARAFEESSQRSIDRAVRAAALAWVLENMPDRFIVRPGFAQELADYVEGVGEFPDDAVALTGVEQNARRFKHAVNPPAVGAEERRQVIGTGDDGDTMFRTGPARAGEPQADEDGRYPGQEPRDRFATPKDPLFSPDRR